MTSVENLARDDFLHNLRGAGVDIPTALRNVRFGVKRTWLFAVRMSAFDPKRTFGLIGIFDSSGGGRSPCFYVARTDHFAPLLDFVGDQLSAVSG
jgi:hypothetical protein